MKRWNLRSIETAVIGFFLIRLYGIWFPPIETWHSWRQTLTGMMARNMYEKGFDFLHPMIDMGGSRTGIIGSEFPFYQSLIAMMSEIAGYQHWYGRLISLLTATVASWCFFYIIKRIFSERTAWFATLLFMSSLWFSFSRKTMPDTFAVSLVLIGVYFAMKYSDGKRFINLVFAGIVVALGGLCKIPAVYLMGMILPVVLNRSVDSSIKRNLICVLAVAGLIVGWWYFYWVPSLVETYRFELFFPKGIVEGINEIRPLWADFLQKFYFGGLRSYIALLPLLFGVIWLFKKKNILLSSGFAVLTAVFVLFAIKTGTVFPTHNYYILPFVPVMAVLAALGLEFFGPRWSLILLVLVCIEGIGNQISDFRLKKEVSYRLDLENQLDSILPKNEKIVIFTGANPEYMYWYHRKGWSIDPGDEKDPHIIRDIRENGGKYFVVDKHAEDISGFQLLAETRDCKVYFVNR
ncbi:MAG: ArnT family glycosyltransferase [Flavobacteriia bacterium]